MILYGASGHAKVIMDAALAAKESVTAFFDDDGNKSVFKERQVYTYSPEKFIDEQILISIGDNKLRETISKKIKHQFTNVIHPAAIISEDVKIGTGNAVLHGSIVQADTIIGNHTIINTAASLDHDCVVSDFVHISPNATLSGNVTVGEGTHIGSGAVVIPGIKIGKWCTVGAGAVIIKDIPDCAVVVGNPGRIIKYNE